MADKSEKMKARLPRGLVDRSPQDIRAVDEMIAKIRAVYELYGFEPADQPLIEYTDALGKFLPDQDRPNEGVFSFQDDDEQWLSLRYDLTAPMARFVAENYDRLAKPFRSYRAGWVFRNEKPGPGRFRQFMQFDADTVGTPGVAADAEMAMMMADVMEALGIQRGDYVIRVNNRKVLDGVLEAIGLGGEENAGRRLTVLRAIDKLDKVGPNGVRDLLGKGRLDESGDFTKGAGLTADQADKVLLLTTASEADPAEKLKAMQAAVSGSSRGEDGVQELADIGAMVAAAGYDDGRVKIDPSVVRGLEYYTGPVYEAELLAEIPNEDGKIVRFGSVGGGGRYDGLVSRFRGEPVPATGFSIGVSRLMTALKNLGKLDASDVLQPVVVLVMDKDTTSLGRYQKMVSDLRRAGIRAEMYLGGAGMKAQLKYADRRGSPVAVIQGGNEREAGQVQLKDLIEGARQAAAITDHAEYKEARPGQVTVAEADLVAEAGQQPRRSFARLQEPRPARRLDEAGRDFRCEHRIVHGRALQGLLGEAGEPRRPHQRDLMVRGIGLDQAAGVVAGDRAGRRQHRDQPAAGRGRSRLDCRDRADEGDGEARPQRRQNQRRGGVARDDDEVGVEARDEALHHGQHPGDELVLAQPPIGKAGIVGGIDDVGPGAGARGAPEHGQAAETGIEDEDGGLGAGDREGTMARSGEEIDLHDSAAKCQSPIPPESR